MAMKRINMKDIARKAGVSTATVSYIINKRTDQVITPQTIRKVEEAIQHLGYVPNLGARALASKHTKLLGLLIPQTEEKKELMFSNSFYGEFLSSFEYEARKRGYNILISGTDVDESYLDVARKRSLDGIVIVGVEDEADIVGLKKNGIPTVLVDSYGMDKELSSVTIDDRNGGFVATEHLISMGHRTIGLATGYLTKEGVNRERLKGYEEALDKYGIELEERYVYSGTVSYEYGFELGLELAQKPNRPSAIFATADILAFGLLKGLKQGGLVVPDDISLVGFDDGFLASNTDPALSTIRQDVDNKARIAAQLVIDMIGNQEDHSNIVLPVSLVKRDSVRKIG
ncbi:MAG: LacI family DNA-binding transcriptional regulator [Sphaerochaeta sp.]